MQMHSNAFKHFLSTRVLVFSIGCPIDELINYLVIFDTHLGKFPFPRIGPTFTMLQTQIFRCPNKKVNSDFFLLQIDDV